MADDESGHSEERKDWLGQPYTQHFDAEGNPSGHTEEKKDWLGQPYDAHFDKDGKEAGHSEDKKDWLGNSYTEHHDAEGSVAGSSEPERDWLGNPYTAHRDPEGSDAGYSERKRDWLGNSYVSHHGVGAQPRLKKSEAVPEGETPGDGEGPSGGSGFEGPSRPPAPHHPGPIGAWESAFYASAIGALVGRLLSGVLGDFFLLGGQWLLGLVGFGAGIKAASGCKGPEFRNGGGIVVGLILIVFFTTFGVHIANNIDRAAPGIWGPLFGGVCFGLMGLVFRATLLSNIGPISAFQRIGLVAASSICLWAAARGGIFPSRNFESPAGSGHPESPTSATSLPVEPPKAKRVVSSERRAQKQRKKNEDLAWAMRRVDELAGEDSVKLPDLFLPVGESKARELVESVWAGEWEVNPESRTEETESHPAVVETQEKVLKKLGKDWRIRFVSAFVPKGGETIVISRLACKRGSGKKWEAETDKCAKKFGEKFEREVEVAVGNVPDEEKFGDFSGKWRAVKNFPVQRLRGVAELRVRQVGRSYRSEGAVKFFDLGSGVFISGYDERGVGTVIGRLAKYSVESGGKVNRMTCEARLSLNSRKLTSLCEYVNPDTGMAERSEGEAERMD